MKKDNDLYPFFKANIHERRFAAAFFRVLPLLIFVNVSAVLLYGALNDEFLLLIMCAILNVSMWLWIVATALYGVAGAWKVSAEVEAKGKTLLSKSEEKESSQTNMIDSYRDNVVHMIVLPNYKEDESILEETLTGLAQAEDSKYFHIVLAMEGREGEAGTTKAEALQQKFSSSFSDVLITYHPIDLKEEHLDESIDLEVPGKASNLKWAVQQAYDSIVKLGKVSISNVLVTIADADCLFHPCYFSTITKDFNSLREKPPMLCGMKEHQWSMWQAPQLSYRDHWKAPLCSRTWTYVSSLYEFGGTSGLHWGGHHMVFSGYTLPLQLAIDAQSWDGDIIAEDHHAYLKCLFYSAYSSASQSIASDDNILFGDGCQPLLQVRPVFLPVKSAPVISGEGYWQSYVERWHQAKRHAQGVAELPYALLVCWDILCTLPFRSWSLFLFYKMGRVLTRLFCMHILPTCQAIGLCAMTMYWFVMRRQVTMCPKFLSIADFHPRYALCGCAGAWALVWPMIVPLLCVVIANYSFILVGFLQPARTSRAKDFLWYSEDGAMKEICGSKKLSSILMIAIDGFVFLGIFMVPYGFVAVLLAYINVCFYGNRFKYITAAKAAKTTGDYGSMADAA